MIDVLEVNSRLAATSGDVIVRKGRAYLRRDDIGTSGTLTFPLLSPTGIVFWKTADITGVQDPSRDSIRLRLSNGTTDYYIDVNDDMRIKEVDVSDWDSQYFLPYVLSSIDLWTQTTLSVKAHLVSTDRDRNPSLRTLRVLLDLPAWEGSATQAVRQILQHVDDCRPILYYSDTLAAETSEWKLGEPHTERGYELTRLVQLQVDGRHKSATLSNGVVTVEGPPVPAGASIVIAAEYNPPCVVRRANEIKTIHKLPSFLCSGLIQEKSTSVSGKMASVTIGNYSVTRRMVEARVTVRGVASRQADAFSMRNALAEKFTRGVEVCLDSDRYVTASIDDTIEILAAGGDGTPEAACRIICSLITYDAAAVAVRSRTTDEADNIVPQTTTISMEMSGTLSQTVDSENIDSGNTCTR